MLFAGTEREAETHDKVLLSGSRKMGLMCAYYDVAFFLMAKATNIST